MTLTISIYGNVMYMGCYVAGFCGLTFLTFFECMRTECVCGGGGGEYKGLCHCNGCDSSCAHDPDSGQPSTKSSLLFTLINVQFLKSDIQILLKFSI